MFEIETMNYLSHPNIMTVQQSVETANLIILVMDLVPSDLQSAFKTMDNQNGIQET